LLCLTEGQDSKFQSREEHSNEIQKDFLRSRSLPIRRHIRQLGANASAAAGPLSRETAVATDAFLRAKIISYSHARGLFAGASLEGTTLRADNRANRKLYGKEVSAKAIVLQGEVSPPLSALELLSVLNSKSPSNKSTGSSVQGE
jgi:lipid-binding SYLF domain-containing protein